MGYKSIEVLWSFDAKSECTVRPISYCTLLAAKT